MLLIVFSQVVRVNHPNVAACHHARAAALAVTQVLKVISEFQPLFVWRLCFEVGFFGESGGGRSCSWGCCYILLSNIECIEVSPQKRLHDGVLVTSDNCPFFCPVDFQFLVFLFV